MIAPSSSPSIAPPPLSILVVENHADTLHYLGMYLEALGHHVHSTGTVADALDTLARQPCDVLISDIGLSDGDGWELLRRANLPPHIYAIATSGYGTNADRTRSQVAGFRHHLLKPYPLSQLEALLTEASAQRIS